MDRRQQEETIAYFNQHARDWERLTNINSYDKIDIIKQRNDFVLKVIEERGKTDFVLDVGCGTGDLVYEIALREINAVGVDFSKEMIGIAKDKARKLTCKKPEFRCCSIFNFNFVPDTYDVWSANGFIEYVSYKELDQFLHISWKALRLGGSLVLGSRNRLFNIFSLNNFTEEEIEDGNIAELMLEAIRLMRSENISDLIKFKAVPLQKEGKKHSDTGIKVSTRYQFTPSQLVNILKNAGFEPIELFPIHIHGTPPKFKEKNPNVHVSISNLLQNYASDNSCLIPQSSSFMIHGKKK